MRSRDRFFLVLLTISVLALIANAARHSPAFESMDRKVEIIESNAQRPQPSPQSTDLTAEELNAYFNEGGVTLPKGVSSVKLQFIPAVVHATAQVDFDTLASGKGMNPIFEAMFNGTHDVEAQAQASGAAGEGSIAIDWVKLDGIQIPRSALQYLIDHYAKPHYPEAGMTTRFPLPLHIDTAIVQKDKVTLTQK